MMEYDPNKEPETGDEVAAAVRNKMKQDGISNGRLSLRSGLSVSTVRSVAYSRTSVIKNMITVCDALGIKCDKLKVKLKNEDIYVSRKLFCGSIFERKKLPNSTFERIPILANKRKKQGWAQKHVAEKAITNINTLQNIEEGKENPKLETICRIANAMELTVEETSSMYEPETGDDQSMHPVTRMRKQSGLSVDQLSEILGIYNNALYIIETSGKSKLGIIEAWKISQLFGIPLHKLVTAIDQWEILNKAKQRNQNKKENEE